MTTIHTNVKKYYCQTIDVKFLIELTNDYGVSVQEGNLLTVYFTYSGYLTRKKVERSAWARMKIRDLFAVLPDPSEGSKKLRVECLAHLLDGLNS
jgi:hypothetical protein